MADELAHLAPPVHLLPRGGLAGLDLQKDDLLGQPPVEGGYRSGPEIAEIIVLA